MPSRGEGFGFVFLEAMASGIPVIASKLDGSFEAVLGGKIGLAVDPNVPKQLIDAIQMGLKKSRKHPQ